MLMKCKLDEMNPSNLQILIWNNGNQIAFIPHDGKMITCWSWINISFLSEYKYQTINLKRNDKILEIKH